MFEILDKYCERITPNLWGEPLNAVSNLAFIIAGFYLTRLLHSCKPRQNHQVWDIFMLIGLIFLIGMGSFAWHLTAETWALFADIIPVLLFINLFLVSFLYRVLNFSPKVIVVTIIIYQGLNYGIQSHFEPELLNGSLFYLPTFIFLCALSYLLRQHKTFGLQTFYLSGLFAVALIFRTVDLTMCDSFPIGTHFMWHLLIAFVLYRLSRLLIGHILRSV